MSLWSAIVNRFGGSKAESSRFRPEYIESFFNSIQPDEEMLQAEEKMKDFISRHLESRRIAVVTAGSTAVPLDEHTSQFVDGKATGNRGAAVAEYLVNHGYAVIYVHRRGAVSPFVRHLINFIRTENWIEVFKRELDGLNYNAEESQPSPHITAMRAMMEQHTKAEQFILHLPFFTVQQFLFLFRAACMALSVARNRGFVFHAASVSSYYVPEGSVLSAIAPTDVEAGAAIDVRLETTPYVLERVRREWCPGAFLVTIRHSQVGTIDTAIENAHQEQEQAGMHVVISEFRGARQLVFVSEREKQVLAAPDRRNGPAFRKFEEAMANLIVSSHDDYITTSTVLRRSKHLLLLSAKFSMMKEKDVLNEDADGNVNVAWDIGVKIRPDRRGGPDSPVYELKGIFKNKSHSARCNLWERVNPPEGCPEVLIVCSPAGTPDTIKKLWGDFWNGWADEELSQAMRQVRMMPLSSTLEILAAPMTGDWSTPNALMQHIWKAVGTAWSEGEQTRIRQSLSNIWAIGYKRDLREFENLHDIDAVAGGDATAQVKQAASTVRIHATLYEYFLDMKEQGLMDLLISYVEAGAEINITGYSMGGMLTQLGDDAKAKGLSTDKISLVGFGTPRVGDSGLKARLKVLYRTGAVVNVMHPHDIVHAFPPSSEGYDDAMLKIFLKDSGSAMVKQDAAKLSLQPIIQSIDRLIDNYRGAQQDAEKLGKTMTEDAGREAARLSITAEVVEGMEAAAMKESEEDADGHQESEEDADGHPSIIDRCSLCSKEGHHSRACHQTQDVGMAQLVAYFQYHHFLYYNSNIKQSVELSMA